MDDQGQRRIATGDGRCAHAVAATTIIGWLWIPSLDV
jgi:hypothetical protein